jgi:hypothetical protein
MLVCPNDGGIDHHMLAIQLPNAKSGSSDKTSKSSPKTTPGFRLARYGCKFHGVHCNGQNNHPHRRPGFSQGLVTGVAAAILAVIIVGTLYFGRKLFTQSLPRLDELAFWPVDEASSSPDVEVINAIKPCIALPSLASPTARGPFLEVGS